MLNHVLESTMARIGLPSKACCLLLSLLGGRVPAATLSDIARATRTRVSDRLGGADAAEISAKINAALRAAKTPLRDCATLRRGMNDLIWVVAAPTHAAEQLRRHSSSAAMSGSSASNGQITGIPVCSRHTGTSGTDAMNSALANDPHFQLAGLA